MTERSYLETYQLPNWFNLILGAWMFLAPWVLVAPAAGLWAWNAWIVGLLLIGVSLLALMKLAEWEEWINLVIGGWLFFTPWIFGYVAVASAAWNAWIVGVLVAAIAIWGIVAVRQAGGTLTTQSH